MRFRKLSAIVAGMCSAFLLGFSALAGDVSMDADGFQSLRVAPGVASSATILGTFEPFFSAFPGDEEGKPKTELTLERVEGGVSFNLIETGYADDSVRGQHFRGAVIKTETGWEMIELSRKWLCSRGTAESGKCL